MEKESYLENKEYVEDIVIGRLTSKDSLKDLSNEVFLDWFDIEDTEYLCIYVALGLAELENDVLEDYVECQMTGWINAYKMGEFENMIEDKCLLDEDIKKIESMITLKYDEVELNNE